MAIAKVKTEKYSHDEDLKNLCTYIVDPDKTINGYCTFGRGLDPDSAFEDMIELQELHGKTTGQRAYHIIVGFEDALGFCCEDAIEVAERVSDLVYSQCQVLCGVHTDTSHTHAHFAVNTVPIGIGNKLHIDYSYANKLTSWL